MNYSKSLKTKSFEKITRNHPNLTKWVVSLVRLEGFEPATFWFVAKHSIQLSYSRNYPTELQPQLLPQEGVLLTTWLL